MKPIPFQSSSRFLWLRVAFSEEGWKKSKSQRFLRSLNYKNFNQLTPIYVRYLYMQPWKTKGGGKRIRVKKVKAEKVKMSIKYTSRIQTRCCLWQHFQWLFNLKRARVEKYTTLLYRKGQLRFHSFCLHISVSRIIYELKGCSRKIDSFHLAFSKL